MKFAVVSLLVVALASSSLAVPTSQNVGTCHSEDYIACALVTAGCAAGDCSGKVCVKIAMETRQNIVLC